MVIWRVAAVWVLLFTGACSSWREHAATPTPQRPTVSSNTSTTAAGTFELESGVALDIDESYDTPLTLKWGASEGTELFVGWSPFVFRDNPGPNGFGVGDINAGVRTRIVDETDSTPAVALRFESKLPTASTSERLGTGELDVLGAISVSKNIDRFNATGFYRLGILGDPNANGQDLEHTFAGVGGYRINDDWSAAAELSGRIRPEGGPEPAQLILYGAHAATAHGVFDIGVSIGLNSEAGDVVFLIGWTQNFGGPGQV